MDASSFTIPSKDLKQYLVYDADSVEDTTDEVTSNLFAAVDRDREDEGKDDRKSNRQGTKKKSTRNKKKSKKKKAKGGKKKSSSSSSSDSSESSETKSDSKSSDSSDTWYACAVQYGVHRISTHRGHTIL